MIPLGGNKPTKGQVGRETSHIFRTKLIALYGVLFTGIYNDVIINLTVTFNDNYLQSAPTM